MNNKKLHLRALSLAFLLATSSVVMAAGPGTVTLTNTVGNLWSATIGNTPVGTPFTDVYTFTPPATPGSYASTLLTNLTFSGLGNVLFTSANLNGHSLFTTSIVGTGSFSMALLTPVMVSGPLVLTIKGTDTGGSYGGNFAVLMAPAAPVPEPETYGMLIGGLGILALLARRRQQ